MIKEYFMKIAKLGSIGDSIFGKIIASILALPTIIFLNFVSERVPTLFVILTSLVFMLGVFSIFFSVKDNAKQIVFDSFMGTMLAFYGINLNPKLGMIGLVLFHIFCFSFPFLFFSHAEESSELEYLKFIKIMVTSFFAGLTVNIFLRIVLWMVK